MITKIKNKYYILLIILVFLIPTITGYITSNKIFSGMTTTTDGNTYLSFINQVKEGRLLFTNMYTHEKFPSFIFRPTYLAAGFVDLATGLPNVFVYHLFRILGILLFVYYLDKLITLFFKDTKHQKITFFICVFASGIGFLFRLFTLFGIPRYDPIDLWVTDANNFTALLSHPHTIFSIAFMVASVYYFLVWHGNLQLKYLVFSSIFAFILGFEHLFDVITIYVVIGLFFLDYLLLNKKLEFIKIKHMMVFGIITIIPFIYTFIIFTFVPSFEAWNQQNVLETPNFFYVVSGYGFMFLSFILVVVNFIRGQQKLKPNTKFILYWIISVLILVYSPLNIQRRFLEGLHIPFGIITGIFLFNSIFAFHKKSYIKNRMNPFAFTLILILLSMTNLYLLFNQITNLDNGRGNFPYHVNRYLYNEEKEGILWLSENSQADEIIISTYNIGNYIPAYMNRRVYLGHWAQTMDFEAKSEIIKDFYSGKISSIDINNPVYIWYGVDEKLINPYFNSPIGSRVVYQNSKVTIFKME